MTTTTTTKKTTKKTLFFFFFYPDLHRKSMAHNNHSKVCARCDAQRREASERSNERTNERTSEWAFFPFPFSFAFFISIHFFSSSMNWMNEKIFSSLNRHQKAIGRNVCLSRAIRIFKVLEVFKRQSSWSSSESSVTIAPFDKLIKWEKK